MRFNLWFKLIFYSLLFGGALLFGYISNSKAETPGLNDDLSGKTYPIPVVVQDGMEFTETTNKVEKVLDKIEKAEKDKGVYYNKIKTITPKDSGNQYCFVKVIIKQNENTIVKEEILECADGRKKATGPSYWELFAEFYYRDVNTPEYCRAYNRPNHTFKSFGRVCLDKNGEWSVK